MVLQLKQATPTLSALQVEKVSLPDDGYIATRCRPTPTGSAFWRRRTTPNTDHTMSSHRTHRSPLCTRRLHNACKQSNAGAKRASPSRVLTFRRYSPPSQTSKKVRRLSKNLVGLVAWHFVPTRLFFFVGGHVWARWVQSLFWFTFTLVLLHLAAGAGQKSIFLRVRHTSAPVRECVGYRSFRVRTATTSFYHILLPSVVFYIF